MTATLKHAKYVSHKFVPHPSLRQKLYKKFRYFSTIHPDYPLTKFLFRSSIAIQKERIRHAQSKYWYMIHPYSMFNYFQQIFATLLYLFLFVIDLFVIITEVVDKNISVATLSMIWVFTAFSLINGFLVFFIGYVDKKVIIVIDRFQGKYKGEETYIELAIDRILKKNMTVFFFADILPAITYLIHSFTRTNKYSNILLSGAFIIRTLRIYRTKQIFKNLNILRYSEVFAKRLQWYYLMITVVGFILTLIFFSLTQIMVPLLLETVTGLKSKLNYFTYLQSKYELSQKSLNKYMIFMFFLCSALKCLLIAPHGFLLYFYGNVIENIIITCFVLLGIAVRAYALIMTKRLIAPFYFSSSEFINFRNMAKIMLVQKEADHSVFMQYTDFMKYNIKCDYINEKEILSLLQTNMKYEIFKETSANLIRKCHLFESLPEEFIINLALRLKTESFSAGKWVVRVGEKATCMYFISLGTVAIYNSTGSEVCHMHDGNYFGEIGLLSRVKNVRIADVLAIEYCNFYRLDAEDFERVIQEQSEFLLRISDTAKSRGSDSKT